MDISVIIPTYKPGDYLWECLYSLIQQTYPKESFEIILVLNGCCEPYSSKIKEFISINMKDINVCFIQTDVGGVSNARNIGIEKSIGKYILFIDDDDYVSIEYLSSLMEVAVPNGIVLSDALSFSELDKKTNYNYVHHLTYNKIRNLEFVNILTVRKYFNGPCMKLIGRNVISDKRFSPKFRNGEDSLFMFSISDKVECIKVAPEKAVYYRRIRFNSAFFSSKNISYTVKNSIKLLMAFSCVYFKSPLSYNFLFYINRCLACVKSLVIEIKHKIK